MDEPFLSADFLRLPVSNLCQRNEPLATPRFGYLFIPGKEFRPHHPRVDPGSFFDGALLYSYVSYIQTL
jgi:hypothetical protein